MDVEALAATAVLSAALLPLLGWAYRSGSRAMAACVVLCWGLSSTAIFWAAGFVREPVPREDQIRDRPVEAATDGYVTARACKACHPREYATWHASYHRTMTQIATPEAVVGDFDVATVSIEGREYGLERAGGEFRVIMEGPPGEGGPARIERRVVMTTGSHHQQAYWMPTDDGRKLAMFPLFYHIAEKRWITVDSAFLAPPGMRQISDEGGEWNTTCIKCHATGGKPRIAGKHDVETQVVQFGIACEACHGPSGKHAGLNRSPGHRYRTHLTGARDETVVNPEELASPLSSHVCGQCHGVLSHHKPEDMVDWAMNGFRYTPGSDLDETRAVVRPGPDARDPMIRWLLDEDPQFIRKRFWSDGMVRVSGREYNGLIESPCFKHGDKERGIMSCMSCHTLHKPADDPRPMEEWANDQLKARMEGNAACMECHSRYYESDEALVGHTHHKADSTGSLCYNCHMPFTTYGLLKAMRSHTVDSPDVEVTLRTGRPNACNLCHLDATLQWTAGYLSDWYDMPMPYLSGDDRDTSAAVTWILKGDAGQRALLAWHLGWDAALEASGTDWLPPYLAQLLVDRYSAVRFIANHSLRRLPGYDGLDYDFLGPVEDHGEAARRTLAIWAGDAGSRPREADSRILIGDGGELRLDEFRRLLKQRDNTPLYLNE